MRIPPALEPLVDQGVIDAVVRPLMSGKEAQVFLVETRGELRVAKVYKEQQHRSFRQRADYTEGRRTRNSRDQRAMERGSKYGKEQVEEAWRSAEVDAIYKLKAAGVAVPTPFDFVENVLVMEMVADEQGQPAPRLVDIAPSAHEAEKLFEFLIREVVKMLCAGVVHGDLSDFNVLIGQKGPVIIDFPQVVDPTFNNNARKLLVRDVENLTRFLGRFSPGLLKKKYGQEMWEIYEKGELTPETHLTGNWQPQRGRANVYSLLEEIESLERESRARREALGLAPPRPARAPVVYEDPAPRPTKERGGGDDRSRKGRNRGGEAPAREAEVRPPEPEARAHEPEARPKEAWEGFKRAPQEKRGPGWGPPAAAPTPEAPPNRAASEREGDHGGPTAAPDAAPRSFDRPPRGDQFNDRHADRGDGPGFRDGRNDRYRGERPNNFRDERPNTDRFQDERPRNVRDDRPHQGRFRDDRPNNFRDDRPNNSRDDRPNNFRDDRPNNFRDDRPNNFRDDRPNNFRDDRPNNFRDDRPNNFREDRPNNFRDHRPGNDRFRDNRFRDERAGNDRFDGPGADGFERPRNDHFRDGPPGNDRFERPGNDRYPNDRPRHDRFDRPNNDRFPDDRPRNDRFERPGNDRFPDDRPRNDRFDRPGNHRLREDRRDDRPYPDQFRDGPHRPDNARGEPGPGDHFPEPRADRFRDEAPEGAGEDRFRGPSGRHDGPPRGRFRGEPRGGDRFGGNHREGGRPGNGYPEEPARWNEDRPNGFPTSDHDSGPSAYSSDSPPGGGRRGHRNRGRHGDHRAPNVDPRGPEITHRPRRASREDERPESDES